MLAKKIALDQIFSQPSPILYMALWSAIILHPSVIDILIWGTDKRVMLLVQVKGCVIFFYFLPEKLFVVWQYIYLISNYSNFVPICAFYSRKLLKNWTFEQKKISGAYQSIQTKQCNKADTVYDEPTQIPLMKFRLFKLLSENDTTF